MITHEKIGWSSYGGYEGPFFHGIQNFKLPTEPDEADRYIAAITAAEGGRYDSLNMYDRGIISVGVIQWIEAGQYTVSGMLGYVAEKCGIDAVMVPLKPALDMCNATFKKNEKGQWRFYFLDAKGEVNTLEKMQALFLGCPGLKGTWTPEAKLRAKTWAACVINVWTTKQAQKAQIDYTRARLSRFIGEDAKKILFESDQETGYIGATKAAFMTFAINLPAVANKHIKIANATLKSQKWSKDWCIGVLKQLTFGPNIAIYPVRYNGIRPVLERLWNVSLPKTAKDLFEWSEHIDEQPAANESLPITLDEIVISVDAHDDKSSTIVPTQSIVKQRDEVGLLGFVMKFILNLFSIFAQKKK